MKYSSMDGNLMSETRFIPARAEGRDIVPETLTEGLNADELAAGGDELAFEFLLKVGLGHRFSHAFNLNPAVEPVQTGAGNAATGPLG